MPVLALQTDFALRALIFLAARQPRRCQITEIADFFGISRDHLAKAVRRLSQAGYIRTLRGVGGGLELARPAEEIAIGEVIQQMEGKLSLLDCTAVNNVCRIQPGCRLRTVLQEAERRQLEYLNSVSLSEIAPAGEDLVQLMELG